MKVKYPKEYEQIIQAAEVYAKIDGQKDWERNKDGEGRFEYTNPKLIEDVHLVQVLEPLELGGKKRDKESDTNTHKQLRALETLDYCHSAEKMAERTGLHSSEIIKISRIARSVVAEVGAELISEAYAAEGTKAKTGGVNPDSFSRKLAIFITQEDMEKLAGKGTAGWAVNSARLALVAVNKAEISKFNSPLYRLAMHEFSHLFRLTQKEQLHYHYLNRNDEQQRLAANLEEGGTELFTRRAMKMVFPKTDVTFWETTEYKRAADRIDQGLIPKLMQEYEQRKKLLSDLIFSGSEDSHKEPEAALRARLMLGDYEMLQRIMSSIWGAAEKKRLDHERITNNSAGVVNDERPFYPAWHSVAEVLSDPEVFGFEYEFSNSYWEMPVAGEEDFWGEPKKVGKILDVREIKKLQLPVMAQWGDGIITLKPEYTYEIFDQNSETWSRVEGTILTPTDYFLLRVNYIEVSRDVEDRNRNEG